MNTTVDAKYATGRRLFALRARLERAAVRLTCRMVRHKESPADIARRVLEMQRQWDFWKLVTYGAAP